MNLFSVLGLMCRPMVLGVPQFDPYGETSWLVWLRSFELFFEASNYGTDVDKCSLLLHCAGPKVQQVYDRLEDIEDITIKRGPLIDKYVPQLTGYDKMRAKLGNFFEPKRNPTFERHIFLQMQQKEDEKIGLFVIRLKQQAEKCDYGNSVEDFIKDQLTTGCKSDDLRKKILGKEEISLDNIVRMGRIEESVEEERKVIGIKKSTPQELGLTVNKIESRNVHNKFQNNRFNKRNVFPNNYKYVKCCGRCGLRTHTSIDSCPAKGKICLKCGGRDHFSRRCFAKTLPVKSNDLKIAEPESGCSMKEEKFQKPTVSSNLILDAMDEYDDDVFCITLGENGNQISCTIGGVSINAIIDSGSKCNLVDENSWRFIKSSKGTVWNKQKESDKTFKAYGGHRLEVLGTFESVIKIGQLENTARFYVIKGKGKLLIGQDTAVAMGILKIGLDTNAISETSKEFSKIKGIAVDIPIRDDVTPVIQPYRRVPIPLEKMVDEKIEKLYKQGIIEKVNGPSKWVSPLVVVPKGEKGDIRICVDMRRANDAVDRENHPLPTFEDFLPSFAEAKIYSKLDIENAFHQVEITQKSREITTFITRKGLFRYTRLMYGITCAPEIFQKIVEQILSGCEGCLNYIDDIIVFGSSKEEHDIRLKAVIRRLKEFNVTMNKEKCVFGVSNLEFLGHKLSERGVAPTDDKVAAIKSFRSPRTPEETRSFLGLVNFLSRFIPNLATLTEPLRKLTKQGVPFEWGSCQEDSFNKLKQVMSNKMILGYFDVNDKIQIIADASPVGLGAVLVQTNQQGPRVICFASKSLSDVEVRYAQTEKEALALVWAVERFHHYVFGRKFDLITDHKPLEVIFGKKSKPCARIERWVLRLMSYRYNIIFRPGKSNIADPLSRLCELKYEPSRSEVESEKYVNWIVASAEPKAIKIDEVIEASKLDESISSLKIALYDGDWNEKSMAFKIFETELCFAGEILLRGSRIVMPESLRERCLQLAHEGHPGMSVMKRRLRAKVWWPGLDKQVEESVRKCFGCTLVAAPPPPEPMRRLDLPSEPWQHLAIDLCGPLPSSDYLFVVVDYFSRYIEVEIMRKIDSLSIIHRLRIIFARFGLPISITSDNGPQFISREFVDYCETNNIKLINTTPFWPQQNGEVERQNRSLLKRLIISQNEQKDWKEELQSYLLMYRSTQHSVTLKTPAELMFNRNIRDKIPAIHQPREKDEELHDRDKLQKYEMKHRLDLKRNAKPIDVKEGDLVLVKNQHRGNKLDSIFEPYPYRILKRSGSEVIVESSKNGSKYRRNVAHVKLCPIDTNDAQPTTIPDQPVIKPPPMAQHLANEPRPVSHQPPNSSTTTVQQTNLNSGSEPSSKRIRRLPSRFQDYVAE